MPPAKHKEIEALLRERIRTMAVGDKLPAVAKLCEELDVSQGPVLRAIEHLMDEGLLERKPNRGAFVSRPSLQTRNIGVIWTDIVEQVTGEPLTKHPYTATILHAVQDEAAQLGRNILLSSSMDPRNPEFMGRGGEVAGVIILHNHDRLLVDAYVSRGLPVVLIDPLVRSHGIPFVTTDHHAEFRGATRYLCGLGHKRILFVAVKQHLYIPSADRRARVHNHIVEERIRGFADEMKESGRDCAAHVHYMDRGPWKGAAREELLRVISDTGATACLCFNDDVAAWVLGLCRECGLGVPEDMGVMGHDDTGLASRLTPSLTTIQVPLETMGREAVRLLIGQIEREETVGPGLVLPGRAVGRASTRSLR